MKAEKPVLGVHMYPQVHMYAMALGHRIFTHFLFL